MDVPNRETMARNLDDIDGAMDAGRIVYVHCWGGCGRIGTVIGCWLIRHGRAGGDAALERIAELRKVISAALRRPSPEPPNQIRFVQGWQ
jgi:protein-tyrosine phosphatase